MEAVLAAEPVRGILTGGEASDSTQFETSLAIGQDINPRIAITDKGHDSQANRAPAHARGITPLENPALIFFWKTLQEDHPGPKISSAVRCSGARAVRSLCGGCQLK